VDGTAMRSSAFGSRRLVPVSDGLFVFQRVAGPPVVAVASALFRVRATALSAYEPLFRQSPAVARLAMPMTSGREGVWEGR